MQCFFFKLKGQEWQNLTYSKSLVGERFQENCLACEKLVISQALCSESL